MELVTREPAVQHGGVTLLVDLKGVGLGLATAFGVDDVRRGIGMWRDAFPAKLKRLLVVNVRCSREQCACTGTHVLAHMRMRTRTRTPAYARTPSHVCAHRNTLRTLHGHPCRAPEANALKVPPALRWMASASLMLLGSKLRRRVSVLASRDQLLEAVSPASLPHDLGGTLPADRWEQWCCRVEFEERQLIASAAVAASHVTHNPHTSMSPAVPVVNA